MHIANNIQYSLIYFKWIHEEKIIIGGLDVSDIFIYLTIKRVLDSSETRTIDRNELVCILNIRSTVV